MDEFSRLTQRQLALRLNRMFIDAAKARPAEDGEPPTKPGKVATLVSQALVAKEELKRSGNLDRLTVNQQMVIELEKDSGRIGWSKREWADHLQCSPSAIQKARFWRVIVDLRSKNKSEAAEQHCKVTNKKKTDRRRNGKKYA